MNIHTLIPDIYAVVQRKDGWFNDAIADELGITISTRLQAHLSEAKDRATLRMSKLGPTCPCALWHSIHKPELAEALPPWAEIKLSYGHVLEALVIALAKGAGHTVTGEQDVITLDGIVGHRDCVIDGCIVDVKSSSTLSFRKFKDKSIKENDSFGYLDQLDAYTVGSALDDLVSVKDRAYLLAIDKQLGHMVLYEHITREDSIRERIKRYKTIVNRLTPPSCECGTLADGKSGNIKLDVRASYSGYKHSCFPHLRTFLYANGPVYLTHVSRKPDVIEVDKNGKVVYT